jgi:hypothetical protein
MVKVCFGFILLATGIVAQVKQPTVRALLTFSPGYLASQKVTTYGLSGELEVYTQSRLSFRADGYMLVGKSNPTGLKHNYQGYLGLVYNFDNFGGVSPFIGFQPGFGLAAWSAPVYSELVLLPVFSPLVGFHYFGETWFHFTVHLRYVYGELLYPTVGATSMSEIRLAFGLGLHLKL